MYENQVDKINGQKKFDVQRFRPTEYGCQTDACKSKNTKVVAQIKSEKEIELKIVCVNQQHLLSYINLRDRKHNIFYIYLTLRSK